MRNSIGLLSKVAKPRSIPPTPPRAAHLRPPPQISKPSGNSANAEVKGSFIRKPRPLVYAVGFAVVTVAGAILGAQLKTAKQEHDSRMEIETAALELTATTTNEVLDAAADLESANSNARKIPSPSIQPSTSENEAAYNIDIARQIALLENRKSLLNRQKQSLEAKVEKVRERKARKEAMEARRTKEIKD